MRSAVKDFLASKRSALQEGEIIVKETTSADRLPFGRAVSQVRGREPTPVESVIKRHIPSVLNFTVFARRLYASCAAVPPEGQGKQIMKAKVKTRLKMVHGLESRLTTRRS
jgi:hypothetical protein